MNATDSQPFADTVLMVRPVDFGYNEQTAADNEFQHRPSDVRSLQATVLEEFDQSVGMLRDAGIEVLILEKGRTEVPTPDAVFPNNWISTEPDGTVFLFPMLAPNRRAERDRYPDVENLFRAAGLQVRRVISVGPPTEDRHFLEGTGSLCLDRATRVGYAALSSRTHAEQIENFLRLAGYERAVTFHTRSGTGTEFYHTNMMMSIGDRVAAVCSECIPEATERRQLLETLRHHRELVEISLEQTEKYFCGNLIQLRSRRGDSVIVMSRRALEGFSSTQKRQLEKHGTILPLPIEHIEQVGGGSARCMIAEVFLPRG